MAKFKSTVKVVTRKSGNHSTKIKAGGKWKTSGGKKK